MTPTNQENPEPTQEKSLCCNAEMSDLMNCLKCGKFGFLDAPKTGTIHVKRGEKAWFGGESLTIEQDGEDLVVTPTVTPEEEKHSEDCCNRYDDRGHEILPQDKYNGHSKAGGCCSCRCSPEQKDFVEGKWEEKIKEHLLANFCDGASWNDARADRFTHEGALDIAKYFYAQGEQDMLSRAKEAMPKEETISDEKGMLHQAKNIHSYGRNSYRIEALSALEALTTKI